MFYFFDLILNFSQLSEKLANLTSYTLDLLYQSLKPFPSDLIYLPRHLVDPPKCGDLISSAVEPRQTDGRLSSPIIPIMTPHPRTLSSQLRDLGFNARPITWPTVPKGKDRVRLCLHAGNTREEVQGLVMGIVQWAEGAMMQRDNESRRQGVSVLLEAKL